MKKFDLNKLDHLSAKQSKPIDPVQAEKIISKIHSKGKESTITATFHMPESMHREMKVLLAQRGLSFKEWILDLIERELQNT